MKGRKIGRGKEIGKMGKSLGKLGEYLGKLGQRIFARFSGFSGVGVIFGTAMMARRTGRRDRGVRGIPSVVADRGAGVTRDWRCPGIRGTRAEGERENDRGFERG
jgi:hypothetical protein